MSGNTGKGIRWGSVALGWMVAVVAGSLISLLLGGLYGLVDEPPVQGGRVPPTVGRLLGLYTAWHQR